MCMEETRSERVSLYLTPSLLTKVDAYAKEHRWSRSTAIEALIEHGLDQA